MPSDERDFARHDCLVVAPDAWTARAAGDDDLIARWAEHRFPVMVRRRAPCDPAGHIAAAIALPPHRTCKRFSLALHPSDVVEHGRPALLEVAMAEAPAGWRAALESLLAIGRQAGIKPRVYGSLFWQHATGLPYLTQSSDIDLLWIANAEADVPSLLAHLAEVAADAPMRIDGEFVFAGRGVQWRELAQALAGDSTVLVKTIERVEEVEARALLAIVHA